MAKVRCVIVIVWAMAMVSAASADRLLDFGEPFRCVGRSTAAASVKVNCTQKVTRGNTEFESVVNFTVSGGIAKYYIGTHEGCRLTVVESASGEEIRVPICPGTPR